MDAKHVIEAAADPWSLCARPVDSNVASAVFLFVMNEGRTNFQGCSYGSYEANVQVGRLCLRVVKRHSVTALRNFLRFDCAAVYRVRELRAHVGALVAAQEQARA
jgi:hypothetical protein